MDVYANFCICVAAMGLPSQRVPAEEADRQRSVLHGGDQDRPGQGVRHGLPGERYSADDLDFIVHGSVAVLVKVTFVFLL